MKNIILAIAFCFSVFNTFAQKQFEGMWVSEESTFVNTIITSDYAILKVINFSFFEEKVIEEKILFQTKNEFKTEIYNEENGYKAIVIYKIIDDKLICEYSGDYNGIIKLQKLKLANKKQESWVINKNTIALRQ
jgi:hypothetical protein